MFLSVMLMFGFLFLALLAIGLVITGKERKPKLTPQQEADFEIHPTLRPEPAFVTAGNVKDVVDAAMEGDEPRCLRMLKDAQTLPENPETTRRHGRE